jgi:hypothetical protein
MSLPLASTFTVPERPAEIAHAAFPPGNRYMQMHETLGTVYTDTHFAALYPPWGNLPKPPGASLRCVYWDPGRRSEEPSRP